MLLFVRRRRANRALCGVQRFGIVSRKDYISAETQVARAPAKKNAATGLIPGSS
jgi:hypothetical protein